MTAPLVPQDVDLRGMPWMPLDTMRLIDSDLFALSTGDEFKAAVALWCKSWAQVPAASLPNDDRILAHLSGAGARWKKVKAIALRGWVECDDSRLYHPVLAEKAMEAWDERVEYRDGKGQSDLRKRRERDWRRAAFSTLAGIGIVPPWNEKTGALRDLVAHHRLTVTVSDTPPVTPPVTNDTVTVTAKTGTGTVRAKAEASPHTTASPSRAGASDAPRSGVWEPMPDDLPPAAPPNDAVQACIELRRRGLRITPQHPDLLAGMAEGVTVAGLVAMAEAYPDKPAGYVIAACRRQRADGASLTPTPAAARHPAADSPTAPSKTLRGLQSLQELTTHGTTRLDPRLNSPRPVQAGDAEPRPHSSDGRDPRDSRGVA